MEFLEVVKRKLEYEHITGALPTKLRIHPVTAEQFFADKPSLRSSPDPNAPLEPGVLGYALVPWYADESVPEGCVFFESDGPT